MDKMPLITLSNGLKVVNFSSPHEFKFVDGSVLPACSQERSNTLKLESTYLNYTIVIKGVEVESLCFDYRMIRCVLREIERIREECYADVVLVPLSVLKLLHTGPYTHFFLCESPIFRGPVVANEETNELHIDKFCK